MKAARTLLGWKQQDLTAASGVSLTTIRRLELSDGQVGGHTRTMLAIHAAFKEAGIEFLDDRGTGVILRQPKKIH